jgi:multiple antibiotic resistance protein
LALSSTINSSAAGRSPSKQICARVGLYSAIILLTALWGGIYILGFFGITIPALRIAGGLVIAADGWRLQSRQEPADEAPADDAPLPAGQGDVAFVPLTMPLTTGPGAMSVAIGLSTNMPSGSDRLASYALGSSTAVLAIALTVWVTYRLSHVLVAKLGSEAQRVFNRLMAFILMCVGVQIMLSGFGETLRLAIAQ